MKARHWLLLPRIFLPNNSGHINKGAFIVGWEWGGKVPSWLRGELGLLAGGRVSHTHLSEAPLPLVSSTRERAEPQERSRFLGSFPPPWAPAPPVVMRSDLL